MADTFAIAYVYGDAGDLQPQFIYSMFTFLGRAWALGANGGFSGILSQAGLYVEDNRNVVARTFYEGIPTTPDENGPRVKPDWLWFVDTDMVFDPDVAWRLIESAKKNDVKILSALYFGYIGERAGFPGSNLFPVWFESYGGEEYGTIRREFWNRGGVIRLSHCGLGCCIIHREVIEKLAKAYAGTDWKWFDRDPGSKNGKPSRKGEDISFCYRASLQGYGTYGDPSIQVGHMKMRMETLQTYLDAERLRQEYRTISQPEDPEFVALKKQHNIK